MVLIPDQGAVEKLAPASTDPAFGDRVHARRPDVAEHGPDPRISKDRVERSRIVRAAIADHELDPVRLLAEIHDQVAGLLGGQRPGGMQSDPEDADAPGGVLDHGQDVSLGAVQQARGEEIARQDRLGLGAQELQPGKVCSSRRGVDPGVLQDFPHGRRCYFHSQAGDLAVDPAVSSVRVLAGQPEGQGPDVPASVRSAGLAANGPGGPAAANDVAVPAQDRVRGDQEPQPVLAGFRYHGEQGREQCPVRPVQFRAARCGRCRTVSWWRRIKISAVFHVSSR